MKEKVIYRNITVSGRTDSFGAQLHAKLSGFAFGMCPNNEFYRYYHTSFENVSHGCQDISTKLDSLINIPIVTGKRIHANYRRIEKVYRNPLKYFNDHTLNELRRLYWDNKTYEEINQIAIHIRRGDLHKEHADRRRFQGNAFYSRVIPVISSRYNDSMPITIYSEGEEKDFRSIFDAWPEYLMKMVNFRLGIENRPEEGVCLTDTFHELVSSRVLVPARSSLSFCASLYNENDVWYERNVGKRRPSGTHKPLPHWKLYSDGEKRSPKNRNFYL